MIVVTRLNGQEFALNPDLIERAEAAPDTIITLVDATKYVVSEPLRDVLRAIRDYRASIIATAHLIEQGQYLPVTEQQPEERHDEDSSVVPFPHRGGN